MECGCEIRKRGVCRREKGHLDPVINDRRQSQPPFKQPFRLRSSPNAFRSAKRAGERVQFLGNFIPAILAPRPAA